MLLLAAQRHFYNDLMDFRYYSIKKEHHSSLEYLSHIIYFILIVFSYHSISSFKLYHIYT